MIPITVPSRTVMNVALVAMTREIRSPKRSWAKMSAPGPHSTPRMCLALIPPFSPKRLPAEIADRLAVEVVGVDPEEGAHERADDRRQVHEQHDAEADHRDLVATEPRPNDLPEATTDHAAEE
jgi:hypothetical protein